MFNKGFSFTQQSRHTRAQKLKETWLKFANQLIYLGFFSIIMMCVLQQIEPNSSPDNDFMFECCFLAITLGLILKIFLEAKKQPKQTSSRISDQF